MRLTWVTDPHLNHVSADAREHWIEQIKANPTDGLLLSGDISEANDVVFQLHRIAETLSLPIYFILGNHDFYRGSFATTRQAVIRASRENPWLHYLTDSAALELDIGVFLVGEDGWGDATEGDYEGSPIRLNDFPMIDDFCRLDPRHWKEKLRELGRESAVRLEAKLGALPAGVSEVVVLTHVPPFREACWYQGQTTDDLWAPFFVCGEVGRLLRQVSQSRIDCRFNVLCGHTHHEGVATIEKNLVAYTGAAEYGHPEIEAVIRVQNGTVVVKP